MMRFRTTAAALLVLLPVMAPAQTAPGYDAFLREIIVAGCVISDLEQAYSVLEASGLTEAQAGAAADEMTAAGILVERMDVLTLTHSDCPAATPGGSPDTEGLESAVAWMTRLSPAQAGGVLAEIMTRRGCVVADDNFNVFEGEVATAIAGRFGFELPEQGEVNYDAFYTRLDQMGEAGGDYLSSNGQIENLAGAVRLSGCDDS